MLARTYRSRLLLFIAVLLVGCAGRAPIRPDAQVSADCGHAAMKERILVIFADPSLARVPVAPGGNFYRQRAAYQSSTWSARVSAKIADDYQLHEVYAWP